MTLRDKELQAQREYEQAMKDLETKKPAGSVFKIHAENGSQAGRIIYEPDTDTLAIELNGVNFKIDGKFIGPINQALNKLLSE